MKKKSVLFVLILLLAVGFAAVSTSLIINGNTKIGTNEDDFNVYFSDAYINETQDKSVITSDTTIDFTTELKTLGSTYTLDYDVTNGSKNYDADVEMNCTAGNEYLSVVNDFDDETNLSATKTRRGKLTLKLIKSYAGDELEVNIKCTIDANAVERTSLGIQDRNEIGVVATDENNVNLNAKAYEITGSEEEALLNSLVETGYIGAASEVDALIEVKSDNFDSIATTTFDVSSIASEGDTVVILHFDEETNEWEYISEEIVDTNGEVTGDFTSYSPVAILIIEDNVNYIPFTLKEDNYTQVGITKTGNVVIPENFEYQGVHYKVTAIEANVFNNSSSLTSVTIPKSVISIKGNAFYNCVALNSININSKNPVYYSENGVVFTKDMKTIVRYPSGHTRNSYTIPSSVTTIGSFAFQGAEKLTSLIIPKSVNSIQLAAIAECKNLTSITIPESVLKIDSWAFSNCLKLTSLTIPASVTNIGNNVFGGCNSLSKVTFSDTSTWYIGSSYGATTTQISVTNTSTNATNLKTNYLAYYWTKK